jgi:hypothetical protein
MKSIKKTMAALALASMMLPGIAQAQTQPDPGPIDNYLDCATKCINTTPSWSWKRTVCATDCYIKFIAELL